MGTTGGDREALLQDITSSGVYAVVAPNMGKQIVAFQTMMDIMAERFPGCFSGYELQVVESHQRSKVDTSGTAKAVIASFQKMGLNFNEVHRFLSAQVVVCLLFAGHFISLEYLNKRISFFLFCRVK